MPEKWEMRWGDVAFWAKLSPFKHTGVFPEQAAQWEFIRSMIEEKNDEDTLNQRDSGQARMTNDKKMKVLNLFAYTGVASLVAAAAGAEVTHVDSSGAAMSWAKENQKLSGMEDKPIRWILDDVMKFIEREVRRGSTYDAIIMDPPIYGHGPNHEVWDFMKHFPKLVETCVSLLSDTPAFMLVNAYAISASALMLENVLEGYLKGRNGSTESGELALQEKDSERLLSTGIYSLWSAK